MAFQGALQELPLPDIIQLVAVSGKTGAFTIQNGASSGQIFLKNGQITHARVGDLEGEEAVYELAIWPRGRIEFTPGQETETSSISKSNTNLLMEAARRLDEWRVLAQRIPSVAMVPVFADDGGRSSVSLTAEEWAVVRRIDERRTIEEIAAGLGTSPFEVSKVLYGLITSGLVSLAEDLGELEADRLEQLSSPELEVLAREIQRQARDALGDGEDLEDLQSSFTRALEEIRSGHGVDAVLELVRAQEQMVSSRRGPGQARSFLDSVTELVARH